MLPNQHKITSSEEFKNTIRKGKRAGRDTVVVHLRTSVFDSTNPDVNLAGPRFGLVVSKAVGNAVTRHAVSRKLRHVIMDLMATNDIPRDVRVVVRALPASAMADSNKLRDDVTKAFTKALARART